MDPKEPVQIVGASVDFVCAIDGGNTNAHANARLIAAAPEMLEALEACIPWLGKAIFYDLASLPVESPKEDLSKLLSMACAAVSKARGEVAP